MNIDFSAMQVGDQRDLTPGPWDVNRPVYEECLAYTHASTEEPRPQFEFERTRIEAGREYWIVRRTR